MSNTSQSLSQVLGGNTALAQDGTITMSNIGDTGQNTVHDAIKLVHNQVNATQAIANKGWNLSTNGGVPTQVKPGDTVDLSNTDGNLAISQTGAKVAVNLSPQVKVAESVTIGTDASKQTVIQQGDIRTNSLNVGSNTLTVAEGSVSIKDTTTIDMGGNKVTNVAPGTEGTDAVNLNQLRAATGGGMDTMRNEIASIRGDMRRIERDARAGTASAAAMANLPQAYLPGKSMFAIATGGHRGEQGYAAGLSTISSSGNWVLKGSVSGNSRGDVTYGAGIGIQW